MSILLDILPDVLDICGKQVRIRPDFRHAIQFELLCLDKSLTSEEKVRQTFKLMFIDARELPFENPQEIFDKLFWFYRGGDIQLNQHQYAQQRKSTAHGNLQKKSDEKRCYDYVYDGELIYAAFLQQYKIDLCETPNLHWWKFKALFSGLTEDTNFIKVLGYRTAKITPSMSAREKEHLRKMKNLYALPVPAEELEQTSQLETALQNGDIESLMRIVRGE